MKNKRIYSLVLAFAMLISALCLPAGAEITPTVYKSGYNGVNEYRGENKLIIYTPENGATTGTNEWGCEAVVDGGTVVSVGGNDNAIPSGGFVVSGHGKKKDWIKNNIVVGMRASYDTSAKTVTFICDGGTYKLALEHARNNAFAAKTAAEESLAVVSGQANPALVAAEAKYSSLAPISDENVSEYEVLTAEYKRITTLFRDQKASEYRGVWIRPTQKSVREVEEYVKQCFDGGLNMISVETFYDCTVIYSPPEWSELSQNPIFGGFDVLKAYIDACHKYGMELHVWMPVFYSGSSSSKNFKKSLAGLHPEWMTVSNKGLNLYEGETTGMTYLNPALPEVCDSLAQNYRYILENYDIDGFQLDYIRYRERSGGNDFGYDAATINGFKKAYPQYAKLEITYNTNAAYWKDFVVYRRSLVTSFVARMRALVDTVAPNVLLTADVAPEIDFAMNTVYLDAFEWLERGYLDMIHPMAYGDGYTALMKQYVEAAGDGCAVVPGLGIFSSDPQTIMRQTNEMAQAGCMGVVHFQAMQYFSKGCAELFTDSVYATLSIPPMLDTRAAAGANLVRFGLRLDNALVAGKLGADEKSSLEALARTVSESLDTSSAAEVCEKLYALENAASAVENSAVRDSLAGDVKSALAVMLHDRRAADTLSAVARVEVIGGESYAVVAPITADKLKKHLHGSSVTVSGKEAEGIVPTGAVLANESSKYIVVLLGDIDGNGKVDSVDYLLLKRYVLGTVSLSPMQRLAAAVAGRKTIDSTDYLLMKRHVLGTYNIYA